jgi:hypothetical protein
MSREEELEAALLNIARYMCCKNSHEAAKEAAGAIGKYHCQWCCMVSDLENECGCKSNNPELKH